jgi:chromosome segregation ATPase
MAKTNSSVSKTGKSADISAQEKIVQLKKDEIALDTEIVRNAKRKVEHFESIEKSGKKLSDIQLKEIEYAKQDIKLQEDKEKALKTEQKLLSKLYETENKRKKLLKDSITDTDEFASSLRSLGVQIGKDNKLFEAMNSNIDSVATTLNSVGQIVSTLGDEQQNLKN